MTTRCCTARARAASRGRRRRRGRRVSTRPPYVVTPPTTPSGSHPGANATAYLLFDLDSDPTESSPANAASPELVRKYTGILRHFVAGLRRSQVNESKCLGPDD